MYFLIFSQNVLANNWDFLNLHLVQHNASFELSQTTLRQFVWVFIIRQDSSDFGGLQTYQQSLARSN